jgi:hypothetical protein
MVTGAQIQGSAQWQTAVAVACAIWLLLSIIRGWMNGLLRQILAILAIIGAGFLASLFAGSLSSFLQTRINLSGLVVGLLSVLLVWVIAYNIIILGGRILFKKTRDYDSGLVRLIFGLGGALIGLVYGLIFFWMITISIRVVGRVAENQVAAENARSAPTPVWIVNAAKLKNSVELGVGRGLLNAVDPIPRDFYRTLDLCGRIASNPQRIQRALMYPGFEHLLENPKIRRLISDPEILEAVRSGNVFGVISNSKIVALWSDPEIRATLSPQQIEAALRYADSAGE